MLQLPSPTVSACNEAVAYYNTPESIDGQVTGPPSGNRHLVKHPIVACILSQAKVECNGILAG